MYKPALTLAAAHVLPLLHILFLAVQKFVDKAEGKGGRERARERASERERAGRREREREKESE